MNENKGYRRLMMTAAVSLVVLGLLGIGSLMGWWPPPPSASKDIVDPAGDEMDIAALNDTPGCSACGVIESIRVETVLGKAAGAASAEGGDDLDDETKKGIKQQTNFRIVVRMADGIHRELYIGTRNFTVGQKVKVIDGRIEPFSKS